MRLPIAVDSRAEVNTSALSTLRTALATPLFRIPERSPVPFSDLTGIQGKTAKVAGRRTETECPFRWDGIPSKGVDFTCSDQPVNKSHGGLVMKLVHFVKKLMPEKSLKAYAWYGWI
jgi:hypothetical protein